jgi:cobaltochelatase CobN
VSQETCRRLLIDAIPGGVFRGEVRPFGVQVRSPVSHHRIVRWSTDGRRTMPLSIVRSSERDGCDPAGSPPRQADLVMLSYADAELARYARAWHSVGNNLPGLSLINLGGLSQHSTLDPQLSLVIAGARGVLIHLQNGLADWRVGVEAIAALARDSRIALAVVAETDHADPDLDTLSNLPRSTLRRLSKLCRGRDDKAARAVLTQLSLAAGLTIEPWLDEPAAASPESAAEPGPIRGTMR